MSAMLMIKISQRRAGLKITWFFNSVTASYSSESYQMNVLYASFLFLYSLRELTKKMKNAYL